MDTRCAVLAVSFGTRFPDAWQTGIAPIERELADACRGLLCAGPLPERYSASFRGA